MRGKQGVFNAWCRQKRNANISPNIECRKEKRKKFLLFVLVVAAGNSESRLPSGHADILTPQRTPGSDKVLGADNVACEHPATKVGAFAAINVTLV